MPAVVASDLITSSLRLIGAVATGEVPSANEVNDALASLNDLLEQWSTEHLLIYEQIEVSCTLVPGRAQYAIGPGAADFNVARPVNINQAFVRRAPLDYKVELINNLQYDELSFKGQPGPIARAVFYDPGFPTGTINVWPTPSEANSLRLSVDLQFAQVASTATTISLPPGYSKALRYALAVELAPEYGIQPRGDILAIAADAKAAIKGANVTPTVAPLDAALSPLFPRQDAGWILTGGFN